MYLVLKTHSPPPGKQQWHLPSSKERGEWGLIFETIATWFCTSNDFNKQFNLIILTNRGTIWIDGGKVRYLAPSLRGIASLIDKAYKILHKKSPAEWEESTPGIFVSQQQELDLPKPYYHLVVGKNSSSEKIANGTLFDHPVKDSNGLLVPGTSVAQGLVWAIQENIK